MTMNPDADSDPLQDRALRTAALEGTDYAAVARAFGPAGVDVRTRFLPRPSLTRSAATGRR